MVDGIEVHGEGATAQSEVVTPEALAFVADLERRFRPERDRLLALRVERQDEVARTGRLDFLDETADVRAADWQVSAAPADLQDRRAEITGPTDRKMTINALNSGANVWLADFEDSNTPTWENMVSGQRNLTEAIDRTLTLETPEKEYRLNDGRLATIVMRPRGWHLEERHVSIDGRGVTAALFDFGIYFFHNAKRLLDSGSGPYFYLPKLESHLEARLWNDVFVHAQDALGVPQGSVRATVLIETIPAAFEMDEILYELRDHASGLNAGRWDYLFSIIKYFRDAGPDFVLPDRAQCTMTAPMMRAYTELLVATCHRRGAFAIGGMAAFVPSRRDEEVNKRALAQVRSDKDREAGDGFDGSWVAHPDLVPICREAFDAVLGDRSNQLDRQRDDVVVTADDLLAVRDTPGAVTLAGLTNNVSVSLRYLESWLSGRGAAAIFNLMEDVATAEISRSQIWQWLRHQVELDDGTVVRAALVDDLAARALDEVAAEVGEEVFRGGRWGDARQVFDALVKADEFIEFLTYESYEMID